MAETQSCKVIFKWCDVRIKQTMVWANWSLTEEKVTGVVNPERLRK